MSSIETQTDGQQKSIADIQETGHPQRWWILATLCLSLLLVSIDTTIVNIALPTLARVLSASTSELQWVAEAYSLVFAGLLLTCGALTDRFGSQRMLFLGLVIFGVASAAATFAQNAALLIPARAVMGLGSAFIMPATLSLLKYTFSAQERVRAIGIWSSVAGLGVALGPVLGGWLLSMFWWGSIFLINVPLVIIGLITCLLIVPNFRTHSNARIDFVGTFLSIGGMICLVFGVIEAPKLGWSSPTVLMTLVLAVVLLIGFIIWEMHTPSPMLNVRLFSNRQFTVAALAISLSYFALAGSIFFLPQYLQFILGYGPLESGISMLPLAVGVIGGSLVVAWLTDRLGRKLVIVGGLGGVSMGLLIFGLFPTGGYLPVVTMLLLIATGVGLSVSAATDGVMDAVPREQAGMAAGVNDTAVELGGALGIALLGSMLSLGYTQAIQAAQNIPIAHRHTIEESIGAAFALAEKVGEVEGQLIVEVAQTAFVQAVGSTTLLATGVALLGGVLALVFLPAARREKEQTLNGPEGIE